MHSRAVAHVVGAATHDDLERAMNCDRAKQLMDQRIAEAGWHGLAPRGDGGWHGLAQQGRGGGGGPGPLDLGEAMIGAGEPSRTMSSFSRESNLSSAPPPPEEVGHPADDYAALEAHLKTCPACAAEYEKQLRLRGLLSSLRDERPSEQEIKTMWSVIQQGRSA